MRHREQRSQALMSQRRTSAIRPLWLIAIIAVVGLFALNLHNLYERLLAERVAGLEPQVEAAYFQVANYHSLVISGEMQSHEAQRAALETLRQMRHGDNEYFWVMNLEGELLMHPNLPNFEGQRLQDLPQLGGDELYRVAMLAMSNARSGFFTYHWPRGSSATLYEKSGYMRKFIPWSWAIGSGVYVEEVEVLFWREARSLFTVLFILLAVLVIFWFGFERALFTDSDDQTR